MNKWIPLSLTFSCLFLGLLCLPALQSYLFFRPPSLKKIEKKLEKKASGLFLQNKASIQSLPTASGCSITYRVISPSPSRESKGVLLYCHGRSDTILLMKKRMERLCQLTGYTIFALDYPGYGLSRGHIYSEEDLVKSVETLLNHIVELGYPLNKTLLFGQSLGSAPAIALALRYPNIEGVILEGAFTQLSTTVKRWIGPLAYLFRFRFNNLEKISQLEVPILLIHGTLDEIVPYQHALFLANAAGKWATLIALEGGLHLKCKNKTQQTAFEEGIRDFVKGLNG